MSIAPSSSVGASDSGPLAIARRVWRFLIQPTEPISLLPQHAQSSAASGVIAANASAASHALTLPPAAATDASSSIFNDGSSSSNSGLSESFGLIGAIVAIQLAQYAYKRYYTPDPAALAAERSLRRITELTSSLQLSAHPEGGFYRRIAQSPWTLRNERCLTSEKDGLHPRRRTQEEEKEAIEQANGPAASSSAVPSTSDQQHLSSLCASPLSPSASPLPPSFHFPRPLSTSIYFLLTSAHPLSHLHRLPCEEQWVWIEGDPLTIVQIDERTGEYTERLLGPVRTEEQRSRCGKVETQHSLFMRPCSTAPTAASTVPSSGADFSPSSLLSTHSALPASLSLSFPTHTVPGGTWFGARVTEPERHQPKREKSLEEKAAEGWLGLMTPFGFTSSSAAAESTPSAPRFGYTLVCCFVSPGFQFEDFTLLTRAEFDRLRVRPYLLACLRDQQVNAGVAEEKVREVEEMILNEKARKEGMEMEATKPQMGSQ
jgi:predicted cupin superfamily sugar epimerase